LASIFDPHSLGHDGAVIIDDNKVLNFGCHLPLSMDTSKFGKFGLRHGSHRAVGEVGCPVHSGLRGEGSISVVQDGKITMLHKPSDLSPVIRAYYEKEEMAGASRTRVHWLRRNTMEKAVAVLLAFALWFAFGYQKESIQRDFTVPIEFRNVSQEWEIEESRHREVTITLTGPIQAFDLLDPSILKVSVSLSSLVEGKQDIALTEDMIKIPSNLSLVRIKPESIRVTANRFYPHTASVQVKTTGSFPKA
jgi:hypothetical protein